MTTVESWYQDPRRWIGRFGLISAGGAVYEGVARLGDAHRYGQLQWLLCLTLIVLGGVAIVVSRWAIRNGVMGSPWLLAIVAPQCVAITTGWGMFSFFQGAAIFIRVSSLQGLSLHLRFGGELSIPISASAGPFELDLNLVAMVLLVSLMLPHRKAASAEGVAEAPASSDVGK